MPVRLNGDGEVSGVASVSAGGGAPEALQFLADGSLGVAGLGVFPAVADPEEGDVLIYDAAAGTWVPGSVPEPESPIGLIIALGG
jgi:hypothetical protein